MASSIPESVCARWCARARGLACALVLLASGRRAAAQPAVGAPDSAQVSTRDVSGRVVRPLGKGMADVPDVWVTLHRVGSDTAGPIDSIRTDPQGRYRFSYRPTGAASAVYFVSASHDGIAYFSSPLQNVHATGDEAEITIFDTTSRGQLGVRGRHLVIISDSDPDMRRVVEVYDLSNDSALTLVTAGGGRPTFSALLPAGAVDVRGEQGDVPPEAIRAIQRRITVVAPFSPGFRQLSFTYRLPRSAFPLTVPLEYATPVLEVLVQDPNATVDGARLREVSPVTASGRSLRRFLGQDLPANAVMRVSLPRVAPDTVRRLYVVGLIALVGAVMLTALARSSGAGAGRRDAGQQETPEQLARRIADLDRRFEKRGAADVSEREQYLAERTALKERLTALLAARDGGA